jgi:plasmid stabilization system protein ParE
VKTYRVTILEPAEQDIGRAFAWLAAQNDEAAIRWYNRLLEVVFLWQIFRSAARWHRRAVT